ncbi:hypothetical protein DSECCO2_552900 [anaerobic digester metagenome]
MSVFPQLNNLCFKVCPLPILYNVHNFGELGFSLPDIKLIFRNGIFLQKVVCYAALRFVRRYLELLNQLVESAFDVLNRNIDAEFHKPVSNGFCSLFHISFSASLMVIIILL